MDHCVIPSSASAKKCELIISVISIILIFVASKSLIEIHNCWAKDEIWMIRVNDRTELFQRLYLNSLNTFDFPRDIYGLKSILLECGCDESDSISPEYEEITIHKTCIIDIFIFCK